MRRRIEEETDYRKIKEGGGWVETHLFIQEGSLVGEASETEWRIVKDKLHTSRHVFPIKCPSLREYQKEKRGEREKTPVARLWKKNELSLFHPKMCLLATQKKREK